MSLKSESRLPERAYVLVCYGLDEIAKMHKLIQPEKLQEFFQEVQLDEFRRPEEVELFSHQEGRLTPQRVRVVGDYVLWESPLGKTVAGVLLRFRGGVHAVLGDIKKTFNSVCLEEHEMHLHRFLWIHSPDEKISEYPITRVNIGDRPAACIEKLAMQLTARLPIFAHLEDECRVLEEDSYVDDLLTSHNDLKKLNKITEEVEEILRAVGFFFSNHGSGQGKVEGRKWKQES